MPKAPRDSLVSSRMAARFPAAAGVHAVGRPAAAEKSDRDKPLNIEADSGRYDDLKQLGSFTGNVVVTKGSLTMRAAKIEVRQTPDGYQHGRGDGAARAARHLQPEA